jgi:hypothetical protein
VLNIQGNASPAQFLSIGGLADKLEPIHAPGKFVGENVGFLLRPCAWNPWIEVETRGKDTWRFITTGHNPHGSIRSTDPQS